MNEIKVTARSGVTRKLHEVASPQRVAAGLKKGGEAVRDFLRRYWERKDAAEPNQFFSAGSIRTHFWKQIAGSVEQKVTSRNYVVRVSVKDTRIRQKVFGGPIRPKRAKALTIPMHPDAHGTRARELEKQIGVKLFILKVRGEAFLAGKKGRSVVRYYLLSKGVNQQPWPGSLPRRSSLRRSFLDAVRNYFDSWRGAGTTND